MNPNRREFLQSTIVSGLSSFAVPLSLPCSVTVMTSNEFNTGGPYTPWNCSATTLHYGQFVADEYLYKDEHVRIKRNGHACRAMGRGDKVVISSADRGHLVMTRPMLDHELRTQRIALEDQFPEAVPEFNGSAWDI